MSLKQILIIDDQADFHFLLRQIFSRYLPSYSVLFFESGNRLLDCLSSRQANPGLILLDRHMPGLDGYQTLLWLKQHPDLKKIPVVMLSAAASAEEINDCYDAGANSFMIKDVDFYALK